MFLRKAANGNYYVVRRTSSSSNHGKIRNAASVRGWWLIKHHGGRPSGYMGIKGITFPAELVGKKIRLKVEVIEEK